MLKLLIFLLTFTAVAIILSQFFPLGYYVSLIWKRKNIDQASKKLERMFYIIPKKKLVLMVLSFPFVLGLLGLMISHSLLGMVFGMFVGAWLPSVVIKWVEQKRRNKFEDQLVDGLLIISSSLKAGLSLLQAIETLVEEMQPPISQEFGFLLNESRMGVPFEEAASHLKQRVRCDDLGMIITSILVARETGGDLTEVFSQLVNTIRETKKIQRRVKTLTVQGRLQGWIMSLLPIAFSIFVYKTHPEMFKAMLDDSLGKMLLLYAVCSQVIGMVVIAKLSKVEI